MNKSTAIKTTANAIHKINKSHFATTHPTTTDINCQLACWNTVTLPVHVVCLPPLYIEADISAYRLVRQRRQICGEIEVKGKNNDCWYIRKSSKYRLVDFAYLHITCIYIEAAILQGLLIYQCHQLLITKYKRQSSRYNRIPTGYSLKNIGMRRKLYFVGFYREQTII